MTVAHLAVGAAVFWTACLIGLGLLLAWSERGHAAQPPTVCVSAIGPVDANGNGDTTPNLECHTIGANP